jgi:nucleotide-binding universal stress UspA family protein
MGRFLIALNEDKSFNDNFFHIAGELCKDPTEHMFVGMLVKDFSYISTISSYLGEPALADFFPYKPGLITEEDHKKAEIIAKFEKSAQEHFLPCEIHNDFRVNAHELIRQTTYSDLLVLSYRIFYNYVTKNPDTTMLYQILKGSKCPVMILPEELPRVDNIIFTYDNKESSVFAIKAFSHLFSQGTRDKVVSILTVMPSADEEIKNEKLLLDLVKQHYSNVGIQLLNGSSISREILNFAGGVSNPMVVMGAYGRSHISNLFIPSVARHILKESVLPLFIAHR